jgi:transcriptional regulator with XRE-family HTH domain
MDGNKRLADLARIERMRTSGEAERIRALAGVSARQVAKALRVAPITVLRWEAGDSRPRPELALAWLDALDQIAAASGQKDPALATVGGGSDPPA